MAIEAWLAKIKLAICNRIMEAVKAAAEARITKTKMQRLRKVSSNRNVGVLSFEIAGVMSKLIHLFKSLSDHHHIVRRNDPGSFEGVRKLVSDDESFLLALAAAENVAIIRSLSVSVSLICRRCDDPNLCKFDSFFEEFADSGKDSQGWCLTRDMEWTIKKMDRYVALTILLRKEMEDLATKKPSSQQNNLPESATSMDRKRMMDLQRGISIQKQQIRDLKQRSLWEKNFDSVASILVRSIFTILAQIKLVFGIGNSKDRDPYLNRSLSASAVVFPSENPSNSKSCYFKSGPLTKFRIQGKIQTSYNLGFLNSNGRIHSKESKIESSHELGFLDSISGILNPSPNTLGATGLAIHYANLIIVIEKMVRSPQLVGPHARDDLYSMLPVSIRSALRSRLKGIGFGGGDQELADEWKDALVRILAWISPLAHNMIKWQSERSFEQRQDLDAKTNVLLLQTLFFAEKEKTEAAITELLVGLNYVCRFEREMTAKALFENANFNGEIIRLQR